eukprot:356666-Chlamydomonas_euryale.AAC.5
MDMWIDAWMDRWMGGWDDFQTDCVSESHTTGLIELPRCLRPMARLFCPHLVIVVDQPDRPCVSHVFRVERVEHSVERAVRRDLEAPQHRALRDVVDAHIPGYAAGVGMCEV